MLQKEKLQEKLILKHICMKTTDSYYRKNALSAFLKEIRDRGGRVDDFGTQGVVKLRSLVKNGKLFDVSLTKRQTI